jgi:hypothetical protein
MQAPTGPLPGFMLPYEITRVVHAAGFYPLTRPLREGTTYVVRATDYRGILIRVVVDAQSGAIRAVNRIVTDPEPYGQAEMLPAPHGVAPSYSAPPPYDGASRYGSRELDGPEIAPGETSVAPAAPASAAATHPAPRPQSAEFPPLPRPRPARLETRKASADAKASMQVPNSPAPTLAAPQSFPATPKKPPPLQLPD